MDYLCFMVSPFKARFLLRHQEKAVTSVTSNIFLCYNVMLFLMIFFSVMTAPSEPGPLHCRDFTISLRHTIFGRTPLE